MTCSVNEQRWLTLGASIRGPQHVRGDLPNQDALKYTCPNDLPLFFAIADGHGSKRSMRSDWGSRCAVECASEILSGLKNNELFLSEIKNQATTKFPKTLLKQWRHAVHEHYDNVQPFTLAEREILGDANPLLAYGTTLLTVVVTETFIGYWQLGDGDILAVWRDGRVDRPLSKDARFIANETTSLCSPDAWKEFRVLIQPLIDDPPDLILLCTDGYSNSFVEEDDFFQAGRDFLALLENEGMAFVQHNLENWLAQTAQAGSGDDTTLGLIWREF
ncbi:hypothetical protein TPSD3_01650 [Thioflexithrix psekupsensis]|uniref:PPM-type phosphatase domain-containing protein n=1 Tax=Thioflexithrix psekupsensis TaxID=1570016 RepID=A0A251XBP7_9GAMM|nr:hypothetical protein TPSD3_01650 [Thioflexithrix psekupsensis]